MPPRPSASASRARSWCAPTALFSRTLDLIGVADGRSKLAAFAALRLAQESESVGIAAVNAALRDDVVHRDVPFLREDGFEPRELVGNSDHHRSLGERGERAIEEAGAVAEAVALSIPAVHRQNHRVRLDLGRVDGVRDVQGTDRELHARMPFAKDERFFW